MASWKKHGFLSFQLNELHELQIDVTDLQEI